MTDSREFLSPPYTSLVDNTTVHVFGPECLGLDLGAIDTGFASSVWTANLLIFVPLITAEPLIVSQFFWRNGSAVSGNTDVGIYTEDGQTKLGSSGSTANAGVSQIQVVDVADFRLPADRRLWLALGCDNGTQTYSAGNLVVAGLDYIGVKQQAAGWSSGLPSPATFAAPSVAILPAFGFTGKATI